MAVPQHDTVTPVGYQTGVVYVDKNGSILAFTPATAIGNVAASQTDSTGTNLPTAVTGQVIRVTSLVIVASGAMTVQFNTKPGGVGTAITPQWAFAANGGLVLGFNPNGWFDTASGQGLTVTTGSGGTAGILLKYVQF